ncbi:alpha/beta fold hydrolase [Microbacterium halophytorum]|uniref:alpha/beta fold hydrolase n=1 Tax=Microbacterium halophytorum TaxID=2067568 RepID=UPI000CFCE986|nr:alpha/beta hydrolase [Microbacterium halophytorum]
MMIERDGGTIALQVDGAGPLIVGVPGMGETRASFRHLVPGLVEAGFRVATMDLRGHGDSSTRFPAYDDRAAAGDLLAVVDALGGAPATVVGNSMGAAATVIAAAESPEAINGLVLIGPFLRDPGPAATKFLMRLALARPWGPSVWRAYYRSLFGDRLPHDHDDHVRAALALLRRPGRWRAFERTTRTSHAPAEAALPGVSAPALIIMGERDRDFPDPEAEARWAAEALRGEHRMIPGAGHYPMGEQAEAVLAVMLPFLSRGASHA